MIRNIFFGALILLTACKRNFEAPVPDTNWDLFNSAAASKLSPFTRTQLEGIYSITQGAEDFGITGAAKYSYTVTGNDTLYNLSIFCEKEVSYLILEGRRVDSSVLLNGYWRKMQNTETGKVRLTVNKTNGADILLGLRPAAAGDSIILNGVYGDGESVPEQPIQMKFLRQLYRNTSVEIVAHRGGGSTADLLPASENSVEMIRLSSRFGATGIEIDVRLTSDKVPVLYHDATLNERLIQKNGLLGPITNFSYAQLYTFARLKNGERIPKLRDALDVVLYQTPLRYVWLDTKFDGPMDFLQQIQTEYLQKAAAMGRQLQITIGIPDEDVLKRFKMLPNYPTTPSVCELTPENVEEVNALIWAPRWTLGLQQEAVGEMHAESRRVFVWTLDVPPNVQKYLQEGNFDGILSNYPSIVAFYYYAKQ